MVELFIITFLLKKHPKWGVKFILAGTTGIEPVSAVLETDILPLN